MIKNQKIWFTLVEIMLGILIFSIVILAWFQALSRVNIWKVKLYTETDIEKQAFYFSEKMFEMIKWAWTVDYEEYFNRKVVWNTTYLSWHFDKNTWFGNYWSGWNLVTNYWDWFYYCLSWNSASMWTWWCYYNNFNNYWTSLWNNKQRFGQYYYQFIDYNSNQDDDATQCWAWKPIWDEDCDWNFIWDDDDEYLGVWPSVFTGWENVHELYFITKDNKKRTLFRWNVISDPKKPSSANCDFSSQSTPTWSWCLWTIQFLKLDWKDIWFSHNNSWTWLYDWKIDTWLYDESIYWANKIAWSWSESKWVNLFPDYINVSDVSFYVYPNKYNKYSWADNDSWVNIAPYVRINMTLSPSRKKIPQIKWKIPKIKISTSIALNSF